MWVRTRSSTTRRIASYSARGSRRRGARPVRRAPPASPAARRRRGDEPHDATVLEFFEVRRLLEPQAVAMAAVRISDDEIGELRRHPEAARHHPAPAPLRPHYRDLNAAADASLATAEYARGSGAPVFTYTVPEVDPQPRRPPAGQGPARPVRLGASTDTSEEPLFWGSGFRDHDLRPIQRRLRWLGGALRSSRAMDGPPTAIPHGRQFVPP